MDKTEAIEDVKHILDKFQRDLPYVAPELYDEKFLLLKRRVLAAISEIGQDPWDKV